MCMCVCLCVCFPSRDGHHHLTHPPSLPSSFPPSLPPSRCPHGLTSLPLFVIDLLKTGVVGKEGGGEGEGEEEADLVTAQEWEKLLESYPPEERAGCRKATAIFKKRWIGGGAEEAGREGRPGMGRGESGFTLDAEFIPASCPQCQMQKEEARERARVSFSSQPLKIIILKEGEPLPDSPTSSLPSSLLPPTVTAVAAASGRRNAPRATRGRGEGGRGVMCV